MKFFKYVKLILCTLIIFQSSASYTQKENIAKPWFLSKYLSELDFNNGAIRLEPHILSTKAIEYNTSMSFADGELYYTISSPDWSTSNIVKSDFKNEVFSKPEKIKLGGKIYMGGDVHIQRDGKYLYFVGENMGDNRQDGNIWRSKRVNGKWSAPKMLPEAINSRAPEAYPIITDSGNIYFSRVSRETSYDIYVSKFQNGVYQTATKLSNAINTPRLESDAWVAPDESFMIFVAKDDPKGSGITDMYISFNNNGNWTPARNMGTKYNSIGVDGSPFLSPNKKYLFFTSTRDSKNPQQFDGGLDLYVTKFNVNDWN